MPEKKKNIFLIGFMGCGKSTVSKILAARLKFDRIDSDEYIEKHEQMKITEMFEKYGEGYFREKETDFLSELECDSVIIACGGGMAMREQNANIMKEKGIVVFLTAEPETIYDRIKDSTKRPLLNDNMNVGYIKQLMDSRVKAYGAACDYKVSTDGKNPDAIADEIIELYSNN